MGQKVIIKSVGLKDPYVGTFIDKKIGLKVIVLYKPEERRAIVSLYDLQTDLAALDKEEKVVRIDNCGGHVVDGYALVAVPFYKNEFTISLLGRFHKLIPQSDNPRRAKMEKFLNMLHPDEPMTADEFLKAGREALRLLRSMY